MLNRVRSVWAFKLDTNTTYTEEFTQMEELRTGCKYITVPMHACMHANTRLDYNNYNSYLYACNDREIKHKALYGYIYLICRP
jgi:hypothetical protein